MLTSLMFACAMASACGGNDEADANSSALDGSARRKSPVQFLMANAEAAKFGTAPALRQPAPTTAPVTTTPTAPGLPTQAPALTVTSPAQGAVFRSSVATTIRVNGTCSTEGSVIAITGAVADSASCVGGRYSKDFSASQLPAGKHTITATLSNAAGATPIKRDFSVSAYGAAADQGQTDDPLVDGVRYAGPTYYLDCTAGDDSRDGLSPAKAWKTLAKLNSKTQVGYWDTVAPNASTNPPYHAPWTAAPSGSAFLLKRGCTFDGFINVHARNTDGSFSNNFSFGAYGSRSQARPVVQYATTAAGARIGLVWTNKHTIHVRNLRLLGGGVAPTAGLWLSNTKGSTVTNVSIENHQYDGISADVTEDLVISNSQIVNNQLAGRHGGGMAGGGRNLRVLNTTFVDNGRDRMGAHNLYLRNLNNAVVQGNSLSGGSNLGLVIHGVSKDVLIADNDIFENSNGVDITGGYASYEAFDNITLTNNRIRDNGHEANQQGYGLLLRSMTNSTIRNNLVYGNRLGSLVLQDLAAGDASTANVRILHNMFHDLAGSGGTVIKGATTSDIEVRNNVFVHLGTQSSFRKDATVPATALVLDNNLYHAPGNASGRMINIDGAAYSPSGLAEALRLESRGIAADPKFVDPARFDFRIGADSPAKARGAALNVLNDFVGNPRSANSPTVGAHE